MHFATAARQFGTPLYLYDLQEVRSRAAELRAATPPESRILYSLKANPLVPLVAEIRAAGCGAEISSSGELHACLAAGFAPAEILYTGPGKTPAEIAEALAHGITTFSCESLVELHRLSAVTSDMDKRATALLRLQPEERPAAGLSMADGRQFGFRLEDVPTPSFPHVDIRGYHVYLGSQLGSVETLLEGFAAAKDTISRVCPDPELVDLGGGFPWPYASPGTGCPLDGLAEGLHKLLDGWVTNPWFETGRRLTASAGSLLTTVLDVKEGAGGPMIVVDAGINVLGGMAGLGRVMRPSAAFENLTAAGTRDLITADVVGPLCTPLDRLTVRTSIEEPRVGDLLRVSNVGAYGLTASLTEFLSRPAPAEAVFDGETLIGAWRLTSSRRPIA